MSICLSVVGSIEEQVMSMMYQSEAGWTCSVCGLTRSKTDITRHVESMHILNHPGYECNYCDRVIKSKEALRKHMSLKHPNI